MKKLQLAKLRGGGGLANRILALAVAFLFAANAKADMATVYTDADLYKTTVEQSEWKFGTFKQEGNNKSPIKWSFNVTNGSEQGNGTLVMSNFNGAGGLMEAPAANEDGSLSFWHNSANKWSISFVDAVIDSFYLVVEPHSSWSAAIKFTVTASYWLDGVGYTTAAVTLDKNNSFFGIALEDGAYLTGIEFWSTGTPNNGYKMDMGFGGNNEGSSTGTSAGTPEPATFLILGFGAVGAGFASRRRMKKS